MLACGDRSARSADRVSLCAARVRSGRFERERPGSGRDRAGRVDTVDPQPAVGGTTVCRRCFAKQVDAWRSPGDLLLLRDLDGEQLGERARRPSHAAHAKEMTVIALTGQHRRRACAPVLGEPTSTICVPHERQRAHPGGASAGAALPVRCDRSATARRTGKLHDLKAPSKPHSNRSLVSLPGSACRGAAQRRAALVVGSGRWSAARWSRSTGAPSARSSTTRRSRSRPAAASAKLVGDRAARHRHKLQPHGAAHRRGADGGRSRRRSSRSSRAIENVRLGRSTSCAVDAAQLVGRAVERRLPDEQGQGEPSSTRRICRLTPSRSSPQRGTRLPDGPRHRA